MFDYALTQKENGSQSSQNAALAVINSLVQLFPEKHKGGKGRKQGGSGDNEDEDDMTLQNNSEEEDDETESPLIELIR